MLRLLSNVASLFYLLPLLYGAWSVFLVYRQQAARWQVVHKQLDEMRRYEVGFGSPSEKTQAAMAQEPFHQREDEFLEMGFRVLGDYVIAGGTTDEVAALNAPLASPFGDSKKEEFRLAHSSACRVMVHEENKCIASIVAPLLALSNPKEDGSNFRFLIASAGNGWTYSSHADEPPLLSDLEATARDLSSFEGNVSPAQLLELHLRRRTDIARAGNFAWEEPLSLEKIIEWERQRYAHIREWAARTSPRTLLRAERRGRRKPARELLGELQGKL